MASSLWIQKVRSQWIVFERRSPNLEGSVRHFAFTTRKAAREYARGR